MRTHLLLAACLVLVGCAHQKEGQREVLGKLETIEAELASKQPTPVRWALANKREIESAISQWSSKKIEDAKKSEALPAEVEEKVRQYEALQSELMRKRMESMRMGYPPGMGSYGAAITNSDYVALSNRVAEARVPIAAVLERRNHAAAQYREQFAVEKLIAEYVQDRFDLVVDSSDMNFSRTPVLYRKSGEALDITDGVIKLFTEKAK